MDGHPHVRATHASPLRRSIRLAGYDYAQAGAYFVTVCTHERQCLFGGIAGVQMQLNDWGMIAEECWRAIPGHFPNVELDVFVVMPDHVHGVIVITAPFRPPVAPSPNGPQRGSIGAIVGSYKSAVAKLIHARWAAHCRDDACVVPTMGIGPTGGPAGVDPTITIWQRNYYDHIIRDEAELGRIRQYIENNPAHWADDRDNPNGKTS